MTAAFLAVYIAVIAALGYGFKHENDRESRHPGYSDVKAFLAARRDFLALPKSDLEGRI